MVLEGNGRKWTSMINWPIGRFYLSSPSDISSFCRARCRRDPTWWRKGSVDRCTYNSAKHIGAIQAEIWCAKLFERFVSANHGYHIDIICNTMWSNEWLGSSKLGDVGPAGCTKPHRGDFPHVVGTLKGMGIWEDCIDESCYCIV